jgi:hypothetical protein
MGNYSSELLVKRLKSFSDNHPATHTFRLDETLEASLLTDTDYDRLRTQLGDSLFLLACEYNATNIARLCLDEGLGLMKTTPNRDNALAFLLHYDNSEIGERYIRLVPRSFLLANNKQNMSALEYGKTTHLKLQVLALADPFVPRESGFRVFYRNDFSVVEYTKTVGGSFGSIVHVVDNLTGRDMVIKRYKQDISIENTVFREIAFTTMAHKANPRMFPAVYGVYIDSSGIHGVFEYVRTNLYSINDVMDSAPTQSRRDHIDFVLKSLLNIIKTLHEIGLCHLDLKTNNVMVDDSGELRLVDFGFADHMGLMPHDDVMNSWEFKSWVLPPDNNYVFLKSQRCDGHLRTLNSDVYSVGAITANLVYQTGETKFMGSKGHLYFSPEGDRVFVGCSHRRMNELSPLLTDLVAHMLDYDSELRWSARDCLEHEFFTGRSFKPRTGTRLPLVRIPRTPGYESSLERELVYAPTIHEFCRGFTVNTLAVVTTDVLNYLNYIEFTCKKMNYTVNTTLNALNIAIAAANAGLPLNSEYAVASVVMASVVCDSFPKSVSDYRSVDTQKVRTALSKITETVGVVFVPFQSQMGYAVYRLQLLSVPGAVIQEFYSECLLNIVDYMRSSNPSVSVWDIVLNCYNRLRENSPDLSKIEILSPDNGVCYKIDCR